MPLVLGAIAIFSKGVARFLPSDLSADYLIGVPFGYILFTLILFMTIDFGLFFVHYLLHRVPLLWHFHKVHHSAEVLTPITDYRAHPIEYFLYSAAQVVTAQLVTGVYVVLNHENAHLMTLFNINVFAVLFYSCAYQLRHSHIWLSYGPILGHVFISPAHHQIHHSIDQDTPTRTSGIRSRSGTGCLVLCTCLGAVKICDLVCQMRILKTTPVSRKLYFLPFRKAFESLPQMLVPRRVL